MSPYDGDDSGFENEQMDTIDLTNSSPEPPPRRYAVPQRARAGPAAQQTRLTDYVKVESQPKGQMRNSPVQGASRIDHVYRIIRTSDPQAVQTVLLNLCKISPALCGAVARGLAPHSTYAQSVVRGARKQPASAVVDPSTGVKVEQRADWTNRGRPMNPKFEQRATPAKREPSLNIKQESRAPLAKAAPAGTPTKRLTADKLYHVDESSSEELLELSSLPKSFKKERPPSPARSDRSSSTAFSDVTPTIRRRSTATSLPLHSPSTTPAKPSENAGGDFKATQKTPVSLAGSSLMYRTFNGSDDEPVQSQLICKRCTKAIDESTPKICYYHPGHRRRTLPGDGPGSLRYECCQQGVLSRGCEIGRHDTSSTFQARPHAPSLLSPTLQRPSKAPRLR